MRSTEVRIPSAGATLAGDLEMAGAGDALVLFAHGSGSGRRSPRNRTVARMLHGNGFGTLLFDLLTPEEEQAERYTAHLRFDIPMLARRLEDATAWAMDCAAHGPIAIGYFGASTGAAAALMAAASLHDRIDAVVCRGGRPDLAGEALAHACAPTLLIVGALDHGVIELNEAAYERLPCEKELTLVPNAGHLFEDPLALDRVSALATDWFRRHLRGDSLMCEEATRARARRWH